jgi:hypothetical protein
MATYKNINDDWYITVDNGVGVIYINGSLDVSGNITYVSEIAVNDAFIAVAANNNGTVTSMGLVATKIANTSFAGLRFNTVANEWEISPSVYANGAANASSYTAIATTASIVTPGAPGNSVQFNSGNVFTGSADYLFDPANAVLSLTGTQVLGNIGAPATAVANSVALYHNSVGAGGTGVYAKTVTTDGELVNKSKAIVFGLIL